MSVNVERWGEGVRLSQPRLRHVAFEWRGENALSMLPRFQFGMQLYRYSFSLLGVDFTVTEIDNSDLTCSVTYHVVFEIEDGSPESHQMDRALRMLAAQVAPTTLYPFCREALVSMANRAGLTEFVLPVTNVGALWTPEGIDLPAPPAPFEWGVG